MFANWFLFSFTTRYAALFITVLLEIAVALRSEDLRYLQEVSDCPETCDATESPGSYEVHGLAARKLNLQLQPGARYFAGATCTEPVTNASIVPWIPPKGDPIKNSFVAVYADPLLPHLIGATDTAKLCAELNGEKKCLCTLNGHKALGVLGTLASVLPASKSLVQMQLAMQRRCPSGVPDALAVTIAMLLLVVAALCIEGLCSWWTPDVQLERKAVWPAKLVHSKPPLKTFTSSLSWFGGFVMSLAALQTGALLVVEKSCDMEAAVWLVAVSPALLALASAFFFARLLWKQQLANACLEHGYVLTEPAKAEFLDKFLVVLLVLYGSLVVALVGLKVAALAVPALAGPCWTLLKGINSGRDLDHLQRFVETDLGKMSTADTPKVQLISWTSFLKSCRMGSPDLGSIAHHSAVEEVPATLKLSDLMWYRRHIRSLTGSSAGFCILPAFGALLALSLCTTAVQLTTYACAKGELTGLRLASSDALDFAPWQLKYDVVTDSSFKQVAVQAMSQASATRQIYFTQPPSVVGAEQDTTNYTIEESFTSVIEEIQLSDHMVPRVARVGVKGLRPSDPITTYQIRFSPLVTLPVLLQISSGNFSRKVAWSTLPASILSVPEGIATFQLDVFLADFVLGVPEDASSGADHLAPPENREIWTAFEAKENSTNEACAALCRHTLQCFMHYVGREGCFMAFGDHHGLETRPGPPLLLAKGRRISGKVAGCGANRTGDECSMRADLKESISFAGVQPDWRSKAAAIEFSLEVETGEQKHEAEATFIQVQQGPPVPVDAIGILLGESDNETALLNSTTSVDRYGKVSLEMAEYQPFNIDSLRLLLLVMLPDRDFHTSWASFSTAKQEDLLHLKQHPKCTESPLNRARYEACGVPSHGQVREMPITAPLGVWSGEAAERLEFQVLPKEAAPWWTTSQQSVAITFEGADSPVAWAAKREGCRVLQLASKQEVAASADAACHLLSQNCTEEVCELLDREGFGGLGGYGGYHPPKLRSKSLPQALRCQDQICDRNYTWELSNGILSMEDHSAKLAVSDLLAEAAKSDGSALVTSIRHGLPEASHSQFLEELAKEVWTLPSESVPAAFIAGLANLSAEMPEKLLSEWVTSARLAVPENAKELSQLQAVFASVRGVEFFLTEPEQLQRVAQALRLAPNLKWLEAACGACPLAPAPWPRWPLAPQLRELRLADFVLPTLPEGAFRNFTGLKWLALSSNGIRTLADKSFEGLGALKELNLRYNDIQTLAEKTFEGLGALTELDLNVNRIQTLPEKTFEGLGALKRLDLCRNDPGLKRPAVCQQKEIECYGPWEES